MVPQAPAHEVGSGQGGLHPPLRPPAHEADLLGDDGAVVLHWGHHHRRLRSFLETPHALGEHRDVAQAAPLPIGDLVQPGPLLQRQGGFDRPVEKAAGILL